MTIAIMNFLPKFCPNCGSDRTHGSGTNPEIAKLCREDFFNGCSCTCKECGLSYAYVLGKDILLATEGRGDMARYISPADVAWP